MTMLSVVSLVLIFIVEAAFWMARLKNKIEYSF